MTLSTGDRVRIELPDPDGPDARYNGKTGEITRVDEDDLGELTGDPRDNYHYTVELDDEELGEMMFRHHDLGPE